MRIGLVDLTYSIIADDSDAKVYHCGGDKRPICIKNNIGVAVIMPVNIEYELESVVIEC